MKEGELIWVCRDNDYKFPVKMATFKQKVGDGIALITLDGRPELIAVSDIFETEIEARWERVARWTHMSKIMEAWSALERAEVFEMERLTK